MSLGTCNSFKCFLNIADIVTGLSIPGGAVNLSPPVTTCIFMAERFLHYCGSHSAEAGQSSGELTLPEAALLGTLQSRCLSAITPSPLR